MYNNENKKKMVKLLWPILFDIIIALVLVKIIIIFELSTFKYQESRVVKYFQLDTISTVQIDSKPGIIIIYDDL